MAALFGGSEKQVDIRLTKVVPTSHMGVGRPVVATLDISPVGHGSVASRKSLPRKSRLKSALNKTHEV
jgi:hypothetical protein